ncbi:phosphotransferase KptA/Tpt1 [Blakeslea trispora]|nr:phosphotransferase KptA/Tpt1 [Blakeslea trispora]
MSHETTRISKLLSYILRHGAVKEKIAISSDGYVSINELLQHPKFKNVTMEQIQFVVDNNDKKRFELAQPAADEYLIRASQGHSLKTVASDNLLDLITAPLKTPVIHGTTRKAWELIKQKGLSTMNRNHIHFAIGLPGDAKVKSGIRKTSDIFIYINVEKAKNDGILFYKSNNDVILSDGKQGLISPEYFEKVIDKEGVLVEF